MPDRDATLDVSWAEQWEDVRLWRVLRTLDPGFYVDVGAMDPSRDSVTKAFYERGWSGIDVEPDPHFAARLREERSRDRVVPVAAGAERDRATLHVVTDAEGSRTGLTTLVDDIARGHRADGGSVEDLEVDIVPLADLMLGTAAEDPSRFHFLKVDVEGHERAVLAGANLARFRPLVVIVEARAPRRSVDTYEQSERILTGAGFVHAADDGLNRWYVRDEDAALADVLAPEVNPLLDGRPRRWWEVEREEELIAQAEALGEEVHALRVTLQNIEGSRSWRMTAPLRAASGALRRRSP